MYPEESLVTVGDVVGFAVPGERALVGLVPGLLAGQGLRLGVKPGLDDVGLLYQALPLVSQTLLHAQWQWYVCGGGGGGGVMMVLQH